MTFGVRDRVLWSALALLGVLGPLAACADDPPDAQVLRVPEQYPSVQRAVDAAAPGDLVLVGAGRYAEEVRVETPGITVRGVDRNAVVLDGGGTLTAGITVVADGVAVENLSVRDYADVGIVLDGTAGTGDAATATLGSDDAALVGYRVAYVTVVNNGSWGVRALAARDGLIDHVFASGHPAAGIAIERCRPCNTVLTASAAQLNGIGYAATNASESLFVVGSTFRANRLGVLARSDAGQPLAPQTGSVIAGNVVDDNDNPAAPASPVALWAGGIAVTGGTENRLARNRVVGHSGFGIGLFSVAGADPGANRIEGNAAGDNGVDLYYELLPGAVGTFDNCFGDNQFATSLPESIEQVLPCDAPAGPVVPGAITAGEAPPDVDHRSLPGPGPLEVLPGDVGEPPSGPAARVDEPDLDRIALPTA